MIKKTYIASIILFNVFFLSVNSAIADQTSEVKPNSGQFFNNPEKKVLVENNISGSCKALKNNNVSEFEWNMIESNEMLETCLLDIAKNVGTIYEMTEWLKTQGFENVTSYKTSTAGVELIWSEWNKNNQKGSMPFDPKWSFLKKWWMSRYNYAISLKYKNGIPNRVIAQHQTK